MSTEDSRSKQKVGYLGVDEFTFGYMAMKKCFSGTEFEAVKFTNHLEICQNVGSRNVDFGVIAIENTLDGIVSESARAVEKTDSRIGLKIMSEVILPIKLYFANMSGNISDVKKIISHPSALGQCSNFVNSLRVHGVMSESRNSTSESAKEAVLKSDIGVLSSMEAIKHYDLKLLNNDSVTNHLSSSTRFWIIGKEHSDRTGDDKTCFLVSLEQAEVGALNKTLKVFADEGVNLYIPYPIPIFGKQWEYTFLIEVKGHIDDKEIQDACSQFEALGISLRSMQFLGSYPNKMGL